MSAVLFHWNAPKGALSSSPLISLGFAGSVLLLYGFCFFIILERYDFFTRSKKSTKSRDYRPRRRLVVWEILHLVISSLIFAASFYISFTLTINF